MGTGGMIVTWWGGDPKYLS